MPRDPSTLQRRSLLIGSVGQGHACYGRGQAQAVALDCGVLLLVLPFQPHRWPG